MVLFSILFSCNALQKHDEKFDFTVPDNFSNWVFVEYEVKNAPPLKKVDGREQLTIPADGYLQIPDLFQSSRLEHRYTTVSGKEIPQIDLERPELSYDQAMKVTEEKPFVCCRTTLIRTNEEGLQRKYQRFYIGLGPAGTPPEPVTTQKP